MNAQRQCRSDGPSVSPPAPSSGPQLDDGLRDLRGGIDRVGIRLEVALGGDQRHQFLGDIDVRAFQRTRQQAAVAVRAGLAVSRGARSAGRGPGGIAQLLEAVRERPLLRERNGKISRLDVKPMSM